MSNKQVIEILDEIIKEYENEFGIGNKRIEGLQEAKYRIQSLPDTDEWISIEERLPEEGKYVLYCWHNYHDVCFHKGDGIFYDRDFYDNLKPTHWKPLPNTPTTK